jgi:hypothetical protein
MGVSGQRHAPAALLLMWDILILKQLFTQGVIVIRQILLMFIQLNA